MSRKKIVVSASLLLVIVIIVVIRLILSIINQPVTAPLVAGSSSKNQSAYQIDLTPKLKTGKYVSFDYPVGLNVDPSQVTGPTLESFNFTAQDVESWTLAINISTTRFGQLTDSTAYTYRKNNPTIYSESHETLNSQLIDVMTDKQDSGFSKVAFVLHGKQLATISLMGDDTTGTQPLQTTFAMVLNSLHWL